LITIPEGEVSPSALEVSRVSYALGALLCLIGSFVLAWFLASTSLAIGLLSSVGLGLVGVFNVMGLVRPKRICLGSDGLVFRPVLGRARRILRSEVLAFEENWLFSPFVLVVCRTRRAPDRRFERLVLIYRDSLFGPFWLADLQAWLSSPKALPAR
jgi:hypothetical protein